MKKLNFYRAFVPWWYFILVILAPLFTLVFLFLEGTFFAGIGFSTLLWLEIEILFEHFFVGGLHSRQGSLPESLKTSASGKTWFRQLICMDFLRRGISCCIVAFATNLLWYKKCNYIGFLLFAVLYLITSVCAFIGRYGANWMLSYVLTLFGIAAYAGLLFLLKQYPLVVGISIVLAIGITYAIWRKAIQRLEESYYDETNF